MKKAKKYCGKKTFFFEYLRYLQNWTQGSLNLQEREINQKKRLGNDYCNLGNFSNFGYIFENYIYLSTERKYREGKMCSPSSRNDDHFFKTWKKETISFSNVD